MTTEPYAMWLYGSHARGTADDLSDVDILVVSNFQIDLAELQNNAPFCLCGASVSRYAWDEVEEMARYGSLFLQHVKLEGVPIFESPCLFGRLQQVLKGLGNYALVGRDVRAFKQVLVDTSESLGSWKWEIFEMALVGTLIRHASILGCWLSGLPRFGRYDAVETFVQILGIDKRTAEDFPDLYGYRLYVEGRMKRPPSTIVSPNRWLAKADEIVVGVSEHARARD